MLNLFIVNSCISCELFFLEALFFSSTSLQVKVDLYLSGITLSICALGPGTDLADLKKEQLRSDEANPF